MNLLLDALRKSGTSTPQPSPLAGAHPEHADTSAAGQSGPNTSSATRASEENLFAAKSTSANKHPRPGIIPIALIAGGLCAAAGGYYFHLEVTTLDQRLARDTAVPSAPNRPPVAALRTAMAVAPESLAPEPLHTTKPPAAATKKPAPPAKSAKAQKPALNFQHHPEADSIDPILTSAYESYQKGDYATAWQRYREAFALAPKNRDALLGLAVIAQQQGKNDTALHYYRQVLLLDPRDPIAHAGLSSFGGGDLAHRESRLKQLISQQPDSGALYFALGHQYAGQARWSDAQQAYFNALTVEPSNALFAFSLAISLDHLGQRKAAAQYYQQALQLDTDHSRFNWAHAQQRLNELTAPGT